MGEQQIFDVLERVRARWRRLAALRAAARAAFAVALILAVAFAATWLIASRTSGVLAVAVTATILAVTAAFAALWPARENPSDTRVARFIEESNPALEDAFASAVAVARDPSASPLAAAMMADAARRASSVDPAHVVASSRLRAAAVQALAAVAVLAIVVASGRLAARQWYDAVARTFFASPAAERAGARAPAQPAAPRVARIDLAYTFPKELGLPPRSEEDTGDIYAPAGTSVQLTVHTDRDVPSARMAFGNGSSVDFSHAGPSRLTAAMTVTEDGSYRVALAGAAPGSDTEYFIRMLEDRPPDVHVIRPARDREVTRLEEVEIEARAADDFGLASLDLVYSVNGGPEHVLPLAIPAHALSADAARTMYLEDLNVAPGDFVSYYARARDIGRGKRSSETRSDLFFLQVRPFEQTFRLASSQGSGSGKSSDIDQLVQAQKDVIVSTWKLDRRGQTAGATSADDVRAVGKAEGELKTRVEEVASSFRETTMRDPRARAVPRAATPGEAAMTAAAESLGKAADTLDRLETADAVAPEMDALNHLLRAQAEVTEREVQTAQAANGTVSNRSNLDLSNLFDRELQRQQRTNYESKPGAAEQQEPSALDNIRDLARRQDELNARQQALAQKRNELPPEEARRQLEQLTREQADLRRELEELAAGGAQAPQRAQGAQTPQGSESAQASQNTQSAQRAGNSQRAQGSQSSQSAQGQASTKAAADAMQNAANSLRQQNPAGASQQGQQASRALRELARTMEAGGGSPDDKRQTAGATREDALARRLADERAQAEALRQDIERLTAEMKQAANAEQAAALAGEVAAEMRRAQQLLEQVKKDEPVAGRGGMGFTFEGQGMTLSAPGTEAFKQDLSKWEQLRLQATDALSRAESSIDGKLQAADAKNRLPSGADDRAPAAYQSQVNSYFKALADRK